MRPRNGTAKGILKRKPLASADTWTASSRFLSRAGSLAGSAAHRGKSRHAPASASDVRSVLSKVSEGRIFGGVRVICVCGCGQELSGRQTKYATDQCRHRFLWRKHREKRLPVREAARKRKRAAAIIAATPELRWHLGCEHRRPGGKCWEHPSGCSRARASGACRKFPATPSVEEIVAPQPGRLRSAPIPKLVVCRVCGKEFLGRAKAANCSNACRCAWEYRKRRERAGLKPRDLLMPAARIEDGERRCIWCQAVIVGKQSSARTCSHRCADRVCRHNSGKSHSSSVMRDLVR